MDHCGPQRPTAEPIQVHRPPGQTISTFLARNSRTSALSVFPKSHL
jgi:hypothetical protein